MLPESSVRTPMARRRSSHAGLDLANSPPRQEVCEGSSNLPKDEINEIRDGRTGLLLSSPSTPVYELGKATPPITASSPATATARLADGGPSATHTAATTIGGGGASSSVVLVLALPPSSGNHSSMHTSVNGKATKEDQAERIVNAALQMAKPGATVVLLSVLPAVYRAYYGADGHLMPEHDEQEEVDGLRTLRQLRVQELLEIARHFPEEYKVLIHTSHGTPEKKILQAVEKHGANLLIIGKRKMGVYERLTSASVSNYLIAHASCNVFVAKY